MKYFSLILLMLAFGLAGCKGGGGEDNEGRPAEVIDPGNGSDPVGLPTVVEKTYFSYNEDLGQCLDKNGQQGFNPAPKDKNAQCVDFSDQDLTGRNLSNYDLRGANFENAILVGVSLVDSRLQGIRLRGAEVGSEYLLQWLVTGTQPVSTESNQEEMENNSEESIVVNDPLTVESNLIAVQVNLPNFENFDQAEGLNNYFTQLKYDTDLSAMDSRLSLFAQRLIKYSGQTKIRMNRARLNLNKAQIDAAKIKGDTDLVKRLYADRSPIVESIRSERDRLLPLNESVKEASILYKEQRILNRRANQIARVSSRLLQMGSDINIELSSIQDYDQILNGLEQEKLLHQNSIADFNGVISALKAQIGLIDEKILPIRTQMKSLSEQIKEYNLQIRAIKEQLSLESDSEARQELYDQRSALYAQRAPLIEDRNALKEELLPLVEERKGPRSELREQVLARRDVYLKLREVNQKIKENKLLSRLVVLLAG